MPKIKMLAEWKNRKIGDEWNANEATAKQLIAAGKAEAIQLYSLPKPPEVSEGIQSPEAEPSAADSIASPEPVASSEPAQTEKPSEVLQPPQDAEAPEPLASIGLAPLEAEGERPSDSIDESEAISDLEASEIEATDLEELETDSPSRYNRRRARDE